MTCNEAWTITAYSRLPEFDREELRQAVKAHFDEKAYVRELKGEAAPSDPAPADLSLSEVLSEADKARQAAARAAFDANQA